MLNGRIQSGKPTMSGRLSYFSGHPKIESEIHYYSVGEDYTLGQHVRDSSTSFGASIGNVSEVYRDHRARTMDRASFGRDTDADEAYDVVKNSNFKIIRIVF